MQRRQFIKKSSVVLAGHSLIPTPFLGNFNTQRKFKMALNPFMVGIDVNQKELLSLAHRTGFEAITPILQQLAEYSEGELNTYLGEMKQKNITWDAAGLPIEFRKTEAKFREDVNKLPALAKVAQKAGVKGMATWIMPTNAELTYRENFQLHQDRLQEVANILGHFGLKLGLEYVGPRTLMNRDKYPFIHTFKEAKELIEAINEKNVGFVLDSFHWFCGGDTLADLLSLDKENIVTCDLNDARSGFTANEQEDGKRELPGATGVINLKEFLGALVQIGYDGAIRAEPFNAKLNEMDNETAAKSVYTAMKKSFDLV
jgi:sugar phosphate isomerase/epimerase